MADNVAITAGAGTTVAADDVAGALHQRVKLSLGADGSAVDAVGGAGAVSTAVQRLTLASDDPAVAALQILDNIVAGSEAQVDIVAALPAGDNNIGNVDIASAIPAGTNNIGTVIAVGPSEYETVAASQTAQALGATGATGDYIHGVLIVPATTSPGNVLLLDNATSITLFAGGASSVSNLVPFPIPLGMTSVSGAWKITTGANVSVIAIGAFTDGGGGGGYSAEADQFFARVSDPGATRKEHYATMIDALVADGVWAKLDALYIFAAADQATALENLKQDLYNATAVSSPTFTADAGYTGADIGENIDTGFSPTGAGGLFTQNSANLFVWSNTSAASEVTAVGQLADQDIYIYPRYSDNLFYGRLNTLTHHTAANADGKGLYAVTRRGAAESELYKNGVSVGTDASASAAMLADDLLFLSGPGGGIWPGQIMCGGFGSALSDAEELSLYNAVHVYLQAVAGIP